MVMRYIELIAERPVIWGLFAIYLGVTSYLAWLGHKRTGDIKSYAIGGGAMSPWVVGITLAASIASSAAFIINPGFVYVHGLSAFLHYGGSVFAGIIVGLVVVSTGFRRFGAASAALTLPQWIGKRFDSERLSMAFAAVNLLSVAFVVLILGGISIVMQATLGLTNTESLVVIVVFVFGYVFIGGTFAHAYTNTLQGMIMVAISLVIIASGIHFFGEGMFAQIAAKDANLMAVLNPASPLYNSFFSVFLSGFVIGFAIVNQPHIMTKALYVKSDRDVRKYLAITVAVSAAFVGLLLVGFYSHVADLPASAFLDPATGAFRQDRVMIAYVAGTFSDTTLAFIAVALLAAGMSTLDGILVALSSIAGNDLVAPLAAKQLPKDEQARGRFLHHASQGVLVLLGVGAFIIALNPPELLGIFGQIGVYGIVAASVIPIVGGIVLPEMNKRDAALAMILGLGVHFGLCLWAEFDTDAGVEYGLLNPGVCATWAIFASLLATAPPLLRRVALRSRKGSAALPGVI